MKLGFSRLFFSERRSSMKFHRNPSSGSRIVACGQTDMTKLIVAFRNFTKMPETYTLCCKVAEIIGNRTQAHVNSRIPAVVTRWSDLQVDAPKTADDEAIADITRCEISHVLAHQARPDVAFTGSSSAIVSTFAGPLPSHHVLLTDNPNMKRYFQVRLG
jgi:hypothetical protein